MYQPTNLPTCRILIKKHYTYRPTKQPLKNVQKRPTPTPITPPRNEIWDVIKGLKIITMEGDRVVKGVGF